MRALRVAANRAQLLTRPARSYTREEVLGRNCRFLQGPGTDKRAVREIRKAIESRVECTVRLVNYTKSGQAFWNLFSLAPVLSADGSVRYFIGVQVDVTAKCARTALAASSRCHAH